MARFLSSKVMSFILAILIAVALSTLVWFHCFWTAHVEEPSLLRDSLLLFPPHRPKKTSMTTTTTRYYPSRQNALDNSNATREASPLRPLLFHHSSLSSHRIPHILIFTHKTNLLGPNADAKDLRFFHNILDTIRMYDQFWNDNDKRRGKLQRRRLAGATAGKRRKRKHKSATTRVWFLDDEECQRVIQLVEPKLLRHFVEESNGSYKGDICRVAALYLSGGYYFDVDMKAIAPVQLHPNTTFSSALVDGQASGIPHGKVFFNSYTVAAPQHPLIYDSIQLLLYYYDQKEVWKPFMSATTGNLKTPHRIEDDGVLRFTSYIHTAKPAVRHMLNNGLVGCYALAAAYDHHLWMADERHPLVAEFLNEDQMQDDDKRQEWYPNLTYQDEGFGCCCNFVVHDAQRRIPYFFSRMIGAGNHCSFAKTVRYEVPDDDLIRDVNQTADELLQVEELLGVEMDVGVPEQSEQGEGDQEQDVVEDEGEEEYMDVDIPEDPSFEWKERAEAPLLNLTWPERKALLPVGVEYFHLPDIP